MADRENGCLTHKYTKFRFEDSLRKYQPPPRKRVKIDGSTIVINPTEANTNSRLIRLCETRKLYHATSRERASEFSRKKQAHQESTKKNEQIISDFDEERNMEVKIGESAYKKQQDSNMKSEPKSLSDRIQQEELKANEFTPPRPLNLNPKQSDQRSLESQLKEQNKSISPMSSSSFMEKRSMMSEDSEDEARNLGKESKVKDIQFHIALVEQIHLKIVEEYENLERLEVEYEHKQEHVDSMLREQQFNAQAIQDKAEPKSIKFHDDFGIAQRARYSHTQQEIKCEDSSKSNMIIQGHKQTINICGQMISTPKTPTGRFHIESSKGACLFSARIFSRLCERESVNGIASKILKHHPYLSESIEVLEMMAKNYEE